MQAVTVIPMQADSARLDPCYRRHPALRRPAPHHQACLAAIVCMARTSTPWRLLPARELGCGSPATVWRRLDAWAAAGVFDQLHLQV